MIKTKMLKEKPEIGDGLRILVTRYHPRRSFESIKINRWMRKLAPSLELLKDWKDGKIRETEYETRYRHEMKAQQKALKELTDAARNQVVTLLCFEPEGQFCHRHILRNIVEDKIKEEKSR